MSPHCESGVEGIRVLPHLLRAEPNRLDRQNNVAPDCDSKLWLNVNNKHPARFGDLVQRRAVGNVVSSGRRNGVDALLHCRQSVD